MKPSFFSLVILVAVCFAYSTSYSQCGSERWKVKTLSDDEAEDVSFTPITSTVHKQLAFAKPQYHENNLRDKTEKKTYRIDCILLKYVEEDDKDWHLVVKDLITDEEMVVEIPSPECVDLSNSHFSKLKLVRKRLVALVGPVKKDFRKAPDNLKIQVVGVGFFDKSNHPQGTKGRELHPVIDLKGLGVAVTK
jgi:hypothetical protein